MIEPEPLIRTELDRIAPLPDGALGDWTEVLERAGYSGARRPRATRGLTVLAAAALIAGALLVTGSAFGFPPIGDVLGDEPAPTWTWPEGVPGDPVRPPEIVRSVNGQFGQAVDLSTLRQVVSAGRGHAENAFLAARGRNGDVCLAKIGGGGSIGADFECVHDPPKPGVPPLEQRAVLVGDAAGGHRGSVVDYSTLIGVVRGDVGRVELELVDGKTIELPLNQWRGFGYYTTDPQRFPKTLSVYRTWSSLFRHHEKLVAELPLQQVQSLTPTPLCGGDLGPCPPGRQTLALRSRLRLWRRRSSRRSRRTHSSRGSSSGARPTPACSSSSGPPAT